MVYNGTGVVPLVTRKYPENDVKLSLFHINHLLPGWVRHLPTVLLFGGAEFTVIVGKRHGPGLRVHEVLDIEIRIPVGRRTVFLQFGNNGSPLLFGHVHP